MIKKTTRSYTVVSLSIGLMLVAGCAPVRDYTPDPPSSLPIQLSNPINNEAILLTEVNLADGLALTVNQVGVGYKTSTQVDYWNTFIPEPTEVPVEEVAPGEENAVLEEETVKLVNNTRVIALAYTLTNNSNSNRNIISFDYRSGYYVTGNLNTEYAYYDETSNALHASILNVETYPDGWDINLDEYILQPGESVTWALDWGMLEPLPESGIITFSQNFLYNGVWYPNILMDLKLFVGENNNE